MKIKTEDIEWLREDPTGSLEENPYIVITATGWICDGKYDEQVFIFKLKSVEKFYRLTITRSGSYYSEYYYPHKEDEFINCVEVTRKERVITEVYYE